MMRFFLQLLIGGYENLPELHQNHSSHWSLRRLLFEPEKCV